MAKKTPRTLQIEHVPLDSLHPDPANPRRIGDAELETLTRSIRQFGLVDPIIARHVPGMKLAALPLSLPRLRQDYGRRT